MNETSGSTRRSGIDRRRFIASVGSLAGLAALRGGGKAAASQENGRARTAASDAGDVSAVVLGSAQDGGVPHAGCRCAHCEAARRDASLRRRSPCLAILHGGERKAFLIDAGPDFPEQIEELPRDWRAGRNPVDGIFLSHAHIGHYAGLVHLGREVMGSSGLPVYCSERMAAFLRQNGPWSLLVELGNIEIRVMAPGQTVQPAPGLSVEPLAVPHRAEFTDTLAFAIGGPNARLLYLTDIDRWQGLRPPIEELVSDVDIALLDGTFYSAEELPGRDPAEVPHPPVAETVELLGGIAESGATRILFTHINHTNPLLDADGELLRRLRSRGFDIASDGLTLNL